MIRVEINEMETKITKVNNVDKPLATLTKRR
jgi:hypothetical protein